MGLFGPSKETKAKIKAIQSENLEKTKREISQKLTIEFKTALDLELLNV